MQPHVDELADAKGDVPAAAGERVGERSRDRGSRPIDDARITFERVAQAIVVAW
jgi:hypothetical protein